jgi:tetratricopeptide (TPR) repeat protein
LVTAASPSDHDTLFHLLHVRLACLCLISEHTLAAQESKVLGDLTSAFYLDPITHEHLVPWDLRVLVVRLSALGYGDWRKGIMGYYELARECREHISNPSASTDDKSTWRTRLRDTGIRVANVLVEMGELEGAGRHLSSLSSSPSPKHTPEAREVLVMEALVWLRVGDVMAARRCLSAASVAVEDELVDGTLTALLHVANGEYASAVSAFEALHASFPDDAMVVQNLAVNLLYTGRISDARKMLAELMDKSPPFHSMVFNLSTIYELCTERNRERKLELADKVAKRKGDGSVGWELSNADFKL